ncbi:MAG: TldD/PmbA family protein [Clostridiales bacterium]|nr:TldD/PmbA family protein [Clostridiales bacterium]
MKQDYIKELLAQAKAAGIEAAEAYLSEKENFSAMRNNGALEDYQSNHTRGLGFRGLVNGRMGYASTEALDEESIGQLIRGVIESATLCESDDEQPLYQGGGQVPELELYQPELDKVAPEAKLAKIEAMENACKAADSRYLNGYNMVETTKHTVRIANSFGMDQTYTENFCDLYCGANVKEGDNVSTGGFVQISRDFDALDPDRLARDSVDQAVKGLNAEPVASGKYHVVFWNEALVSLLGVFSTVFSAETEQMGLSLLSGKLGETIAAPCVTLVDDPLRPDCLGSRPFDDEGVPSHQHMLVENGVFRTFLHNLKTARKAGVESTGNGSKADYSSPVRVAPSNLYFEPGALSFEELLSQVGDGIVITEVSGLHAGANPVSGDFSLLSKGYTLKDGKRDQPLERITVAGNFYELLKNIRAFASDLRFPNGALGSASADAGEMTVSGKA